MCRSTISERRGDGLCFIRLKLIRENGRMALGDATSGILAERRTRREQRDIRDYSDSLFPWPVPPAWEMYGPAGLDFVLTVHGIAL